MQAAEDVRGELLAIKREAAARSGAPADLEAADGWVDVWLKSKRARGQTSTEDRRGHYVHRIKPVLAGKHVRDWTAADLRAIVAALDTKIAAGALAAKTARNIYGTATKMLADAVRSKVEALRCRTDNPAKDVEGPDKGEDRAKQFTRVSSCSSSLPLRWRRAIALAVYLFPRAGELRALRWEAVDLEHGTIHIHEAFERRSRATKATKTGRGRRFSLEPAIVPLLEAMHAESGGEGLVCPLPNRKADRLRGWLERAGVTRAELLDEESTTTKPARVARPPRDRTHVDGGTRRRAAQDHAARRSPALRHEPDLHPHGRGRSRGLRRRVPAAAGGAPPPRRPRRWSNERPNGALSARNH